MSGFEFEGYEALVSELRATAPAAPESLRARVLEGAPAPRRRRTKKRRLALVVVPLAVVLAVGAAFVHGFVHSRSNLNAELGPVARAPGTASSAVGSGTVHHTIARNSIPNERALGRPLKQGAKKTLTAGYAPGAPQALATDE